MSLGAAPEHSSQRANLAPPSSIEFNPLLPEFIANPYPFYRRLQTEDPVHRSTLLLLCQS
jgi:hypothetical protein